MNQIASKKKRRKKLPIKQETLTRIHAKVNKFLSISTQISDVALTLGALRNKPGPMAYIAAGTKITNLVYNGFFSGRGIVDYADPLSVYLAKLGGNWTKLETNKNRIVRILNENNLGEIVEEDDDDDEDTIMNLSSDNNKRKKSQMFSGKVKHANVEGNDIVWKEYGEDIWVKDLMIRTENKDQTMKSIGNLIWNSYSTNNLAASSVKRESTYSSESDSSIEFTEDLFSNDILQSEIADKIANNTKKFLSVDGIDTRAILLYGPPGTGKSTAARYVVKKLNMRSLRIHFKLLLETNVLIQCLDILRPDAIIIDDIDRSLRQTQGQLLECLELLRKRAKVIIASANYPDTLDPAVLRPGRFDEAIRVESLDEVVIRRVVGDIDEKVLNNLKKLPIAYINEFSLRRKILGEKEASECIKELYERIELHEGAENKRLKTDKNKEDYLSIDLSNVFLDDL